MPPSAPTAPGRDPEDAEGDAMRRMAAAALAAILTAGGAMADPAKTAVKVDPVPVQGGYPHAMSVAISPPWETGRPVDPPGP